MTEQEYNDFDWSSYHGGYTPTSYWNWIDYQIQGHLGYYHEHIVAYYTRISEAHYQAQFGG